MLLFVTVAHSYLFALAIMHGELTNTDPNLITNRGGH